LRQDILERGNLTAQNEIRNLLSTVITNNIIVSLAHRISEWKKQCLDWSDADGKYHQYLYFLSKKNTSKIHALTSRSVEDCQPETVCKKEVNFHQGAFVEQSKSLGDLEQRFCKNCFTGFYLKNDLMLSRQEQKN
jgi:hypothetical protein